MDQDNFFSELEESLSNVGAQELWKEEIGGRIVWLSPIPFSGQSKVSEALASKDLGANVINESKRITLSHAIVGIDQTDLRPYKNAGQVFGPIDFPGGKKLKVDLPTYLYLKMVQWGQQFIDDVFSVFADKMETHGKQNVKDVKFENAKNPVEELGDLMVRVTELRIQLGYPPLVEAKPTEELDEAAEFERMVQDRGVQEESEPPVEPEFDPFRTVRVDEQPSSGARKVSPQVPVSQQATQPAQTIPTPAAVPIVRPVDPVPVTTIPVIMPPQNRASRPLDPSNLDQHVPTSTPSTPFVSTPSIQPDVIEHSARRSGPIAPPVINPKVSDSSRNPRFQPTK